MTPGELVSIDYNWGELRLYSPTRYEVDKICTIGPRSSVSSMDIEPEDIDASDSVAFVWEIK